MKDLEGIRGLLLDVDGTLLSDDRPIPGAAQAVDHLRGAGLRVRITTSITRRSRGAIADLLRSCGFVIDTEMVLNPSVLARRRVLESGRTCASLLVPDPARADFEGIERSDTQPDWLVVGDLGRAWTWDRLNTAFRSLRDGARLLALHKNPYWHDPADGWVLDAGAVVAALEYATGTVAEVVGKPSIDFFRLALADLGLPAGEVMVVGDDPETDVAGGAAAGCRTALVRTGQFNGDGRSLAEPRPDRILDSIVSLI